ncbi:MAG: DNA topoisomerase I [Candidatus Yanofskybacteria bacterium CG10_big_fil_rev_8_21_14_0_10_46_23]|uniref:DNA topoisomerase 1 n=1 Tax=Candidatus Yanofskybacteria bacterium CG10_big_fil_rev_8_21_14_0_10_46_23 TaxID=1975098 RepID=A0A2H0R515_9BACT|nr:MAG: DNA topoisomerase I [Candidatus Yanofskybacteria bacterium CG10_big_fil_rev_8_21_14_0_10_46_23]
MKLIIVESPTKAKTITRFVSGDFVVKSSYGHVRDLPKAEIGIDVENNFEPKYVIPPRVRKNLAELKKLLPKAETLILATDEDREGEAIAWHLTQAIGLEKLKKAGKEPRIERIVFHEITKTAIEKALATPREINFDMVDAQQARRVLDRLVGYKLSPFLWKKISRGLSAGRVQSVAVRLIVEREREIQAFKPEEYWSVVAQLLKDKDSIQAHLVAHKSESLDRLSIKNEADAQKIRAELEDADYRVTRVEARQTKKSPAPPFITSTLQRAAAGRLHFSAKQTMVLAQQLYEGIKLGKKGATGLITYMRTDSTNLSAEALSVAHDFIKKNYGPEYGLKTSRVFKKKAKSAQEAHEAIRPTDPTLTPQDIEKYLDAKQFKLYNLIWGRFLASQMAEAQLESVSADITAKDYTFRATGQTLKFDGFLKVYPLNITESILPPIKEGETLLLKELQTEQHFTNPPARYNEASLIKILEKNGIGRPSTYAPIISTIQERNYVQKNPNRYFEPTEIGLVVNDLLVTHFPEIVDMDFTSKMEGQLDDIALGKNDWRKIIKDFYEPFDKNLQNKYKEVSKEAMIEETDEDCDKCGKKMIIRMGRFGKFRACSGFPECKNAKPLEGQEGLPQKEPPKELDEECEKCGKKMVVRTGRRGAFKACSGFPKCRNTKPLDKEASEERA